MSPSLRSPRLLLRPACLDDVDALLDLVADGAGSSVDHRARITALVAGSLEWFPRYRYGLWILVQPPLAAPVGWCGLRPRESPTEPELLYGLAPAVRGRGLATEAARTVLTWLRDRPDIVRVWAVTDPPNAASIRVLERLGMRLERQGEVDGVDRLFYRLPAAPADHLQ